MIRSDQKKIPGSVIVMAKKKTSMRDECTLTFEESLDALEGIVGDLESGKLGLSESLEKYEQGVSHLKMCQRLLERAERKIEILSGMDADGNPITIDYDDREEDSLEAKALSRSQRRTSGIKAASSRRDSLAPELEDDQVDDAGRLF